MKLAVAIADSKAGPSAFVVWRGFESSIRKAAEYGYQGVELALRRKQDVDVPSLRCLLQKYAMEVSCISTGQVFADLGLHLTIADKGKRRETIDVITGLIQLAEEFGGMINLGRTRGFIEEGNTLKETERIFLDSLSQLLPIAEKHQVDIVIEPVNRYETNFVNSVDQCAALLQQLPSPRLGIMPDVFHMNIEDVSIGKALQCHKDKIKYVHLADSNRLAPGWGHLDFEEVLCSLQAGRYEGWLSIEILPMPDPDSAAKQGVSYMLPMIQRFISTQ